MAEEEDPAIAVEEQFETTRRFLDEWLGQLRDTTTRLRKQANTVGSLQLRQQHFAPCQVIPCIY